MIFSHSF